MIASIMLKNQTFIFYYNDDQYISWSDFIKTLRKFFENFEWNRMNLIKWQIINLIDVIINNFSFSTFEYFVKLIENINLLQRNLKNQFAKIFYLRENIIRTIWNHSTLMTEFVNSSNDVINLIKNLHFSIINYETMHRSFVHENYVQFYNDEMKNDEIENKMFFIDRRYQDHRSSYRDRNRSYMKSRNAFFWKSFKFSFQRQKNVSCAKKSIVDWLITFSKNEMIQSKNSKIKNFIFESDLISTKKFINESSNMKIKIKTKRFIFLTIWLLILKHIMLILIDSKKLNQIRLIRINFLFYMNHSKISNHWSSSNNLSKIFWFIKSTNAMKLLHRFRLHHMCSIQSRNCDTNFSNSKKILLIQKQQRNQMQISINLKYYNALIIRSKSIIARQNRSVSFLKWTQHHRSIQSILIHS